MRDDPLAREKKRLRLIAAETLGSLSPGALKEAGEKITAHVLSSLQYRRAASLFIYVSTDREPDTRALVEDAWQSGKAVYVPKCHGQGRMDAVRVYSWQDLVPGAYGIPEPAGDSSDGPFPSIDLAVVPCVCAARDGRRLGRGAGYYDRFLSAHPMPCLCLCFHAMLRDDLPVGPLDARMDAVATEEGFFSKTIPIFSGQNRPQGL